MLDDLFAGDDSRAEAGLSHIIPEDFPQLIERSRSESPDIRWWALRAMASLPTPEAVAPLLAAAADPDPGVRACAIVALGQRRESSAVPTLVETLKDSSDFLARLAADALEQIGKPAVPALLEALQAEDAATRRLAARALAHIKDPAAIPALFKALEDDSMLVSYWADEGLEAMGVGQVYFKP
ncbi:MAG: HEAT repeat domain-containing protein [Chloroflexi bacterium]|nr:HEAT repeat domain-containing protein [Chloroflexota bacterium]